MRASLLLFSLCLPHLGCKPDGAHQAAARSEVAPGGPAARGAEAAQAEPSGQPLEVPPGGPVARAPETAPALSAAAACVDAQLATRGLNQYGDPRDTVYAGGSPLFDEKTGATQDRIARVLARQPEIARACAHGGP